MGRPPVFSPETKTRIVLSVLSGGITVAEAARKEKVSEQSIGRWKVEFLEAGKTALTAGKSGPSTREAQLEAQVEDLTLALGKAAVVSPDNPTASTRVSMVWKGIRRGLAHFEPSGDDDLDTVRAAGTRRPSLAADAAPTVGRPRRLRHHDRLDQPRQPTLPCRRAGPAPAAS